MDAATLRVLVEVNGVTRATRELRDVDNAGTRAARSAGAMASNFDGADRSVRRATRGFSGLAAALGGGGRGIQGFTRHLDDFGGSANGATATIGGFKVALAALVPIFVGFGGAAVAAGASLGPLIGLAAAAGGAFAAAAQGMGVFRLATMGVVDALKEQVQGQGAAGGAATQSASAQRSAARTIQSAQDGLRTATESLNDAQREQRDAAAALGPAYTAARRGLVDMRSEAVSAVLSWARLTLGLEEARGALADLINGPSPLDLADAQDAVADSTRGSERAVMNLWDAQQGYNAVVRDATSTSQDLEKARLDLRDAENAVDDAQRESARAALALSEIEKPASAHDLTSARLDVVEAEHALSEARRSALRQQSDLNAAEAAGVSGSKEVLEARRAIAEAEDGVRDARLAVVRAQQGVRDAQLAANESMTAGAAAAGKLNEKMSGLPPAAQAFVRQLIAMQPRLDALRNTAASGFFPGATAGLKAAEGSFGSVNKVVGQTAVALGDAARKSGELVGSNAFGRDIEIIGGRNAKVIATLGEALRHVISALRHVLVAAGPLTQWLADMANNWALNAAQAAKAGRENGKLAGFFERTRAITARLASIVGHLASGLIGLGHVGRRTGDSIWASIDRAAGRFDEWANSTNGQKALHDFFERTRELAAALTPVLAGIASALGLIVLKIFPLSSVLAALGPLTNEAVTAFIAFKLATIAVGIASKAAGAAIVVATFATGGWTGAFWALNAALAANPIGLVVVGLAALVAGLVIAYRESETFRKIVDTAFKVAKAAFGILLTAAQATFNWLKSNWPLVLAILTGPIGLAVIAIRAFGPKLLEAARWLLSQFIAGVKGGLQAVVDLGGWIVSQVVAGIKAIVGFAADVGGWLKNRVVEGVHGALAGFTSLGGWMVNRIAEGFKIVTDLLASVGGWLKNRVVEFIHAVAGDFVGVGGWALAKIVEGFKVLTEALSSVGGWLRNRVTESLHAVRDSLIGLGGWILDKILDGLTSVGSKVREAITTLKDLIVGAIKSVFSSAIKLPLKIDLPDINPFGGSGTGDGRVGPMPSGSLQAIADASRGWGLSGGRGPGQGYRPGDDGWHGQNRARDLSGSASQMLAFAKMLANGPNAGKLLELIYTPLGFGIKNGQRVPMSFFGSAVAADHYDHVHVAMATGGVVKQSGWAVVGERGPELAHFPGGSTVYDAGQTQGAMSPGGGAPNPEDWQFVLYIGGEKIDERIDVRMERRDQRTHGAWGAGVRR